jgi:hypothetical protein
VAQWSLTIRNGPRVERARFDTCNAALEALQERLDELTPQARREAIEVLRRRYDAARQVVVRGEIAGPGRRRGGIDLRGDGSSEAYTGRWRRTLVALQPGESAVDGLRRALSAGEG